MTGMLSVNVMHDVSSPGPPDSALAELGQPVARAPTGSPTCHSKANATDVSMGTIV